MTDNSKSSKNTSNENLSPPSDNVDISRRRLLAGTGALLSASAVGASFADTADAGKGSATPNQAEKPDVIVIGGGFCGVTATRELRRQGYSVTLLEARNRLGGRTFTAEFAGKMVDMGGTWFHWQQPHVWSEVRRYGVEVAESKGAVADDMIYLDYDGNRHETKASEIWGELSSATEGFFESAYEIMPRPADPLADDKWVKADTFSVQEKLDSADLTPEMKILVDTYFTLCGSADAKDISWVDMMRWYALSGYSLTLLNDSIARYKVKGGTKELIDAMAADADADIRLSTPVYKISQTGDKVEVLTDYDDRLVASAVVVAVPLNVLKDVEFSPALSAAKMEVSQQTHAGNGTKLHILLDKAYPQFSGWAPGGNTPLNFLFWDGVSDGKTHLIGFGPSMDTLDVNDTEDVQKAIRAFLPDANVLQAYGYQWGIDPYSQGVWGVSRPGQMSRFIESLQQPQGRIHFANADWANGWRGFIDGAIEQGIVSAREVHRQLSQNS